jgi:hypothetical protein
MAYDPATAQLVLFGGIGLGGGQADTWAWDGSTWTRLAPAASPSLRSSPSMAYDPAIAQLVLFGGYDGAPHDDTWTWDGITWTQQAPTVSPPARAEAAMAYDLATAQLVLFGGTQFAHRQDDTWTYEAGRKPQSVTFTSTPPSHARYRGADDQSYTATATATSGLPVTLSADPSSTSGCALSGGTVSYGGGAGTCVIDASQPGNGSYLPAPRVTQRFTISPARLSITASSAAMTYGGTVPAITPGYSGFAGQDGPSSLSAPPSCSTTATPASPAGTYPSACAGAADPNYAISYVPGTVTVAEATTVTTLTAHRDSTARRSPITLTADVTPIASAQPPAGEVDFYAGNPGRHHRLLGTAALAASGTAVFTTTTLSCGHQQLYAVYLGSTNDLGSTSSTIRSSGCDR